MDKTERKETSPLLWLAVTLLLVVGLMAFVAAFTAPFGAGYGMMGWGMGWGAMFMVLPALLLVLLLMAVLGAFRSSGTPPAYAPPPPLATSAIDVLNARYARGEISRDEYHRIREDLEGRPH